jgi:site-specific DNA recombinase
MLSHKVFCGCCGGAMAIIGRDYLACSAARRQGTCSNRQGIRRGALENLILDALVPAPRRVARLNANDNMGVIGKSGAQRAAGAGTPCRPAR